MENKSKIKDLALKMNKFYSLTEKSRKAIKYNPVINSIIGGTLKNDMESTFVLNNDEVSANSVYDDFLASGLKQAILFIPGLFCDEKVWIDKEKKEKKIGIASELRRKGYYPIYLRFNPGLNIYQNGQNLSNLLNNLYEVDPNFSYNIVSYSQGGLFLRSALYYIESSKNNWKQNVQKAISIACPNAGSYIEKAGVRLVNFLNTVPMFGAQLFTLISNMRSDAMKDLSYGIIRKEDSQNLTSFLKGEKKLYFGELDDVDCYQIYSLFTEKKHLKYWFGDGAVEKSSLEYLSDLVYKKKNNPEKRIICLKGLSHLDIIYSFKTLEYILLCLQD